MSSAASLTSDASDATWGRMHSTIPLEPLSLDGRGVGERVRAISRESGTVKRFSKSVAAEKLTFAGRVRLSK